VGKRTKKKHKEDKIPEELKADRIAGELQQKMEVPHCQSFVQVNKF